MFCIGLRTSSLRSKLALAVIAFSLAATPAHAQQTELSGVSDGSGEAAATSPDTATETPPGEPPAKGSSDKPVEAAVNTEPPAPTEPPARRTTWVAHLLRRQSADFLVRGLHFKATDLPIVLVAKDGELRPTITIEGEYERPGWRLALALDRGQFYPLNVDPDTKEFHVTARLRGRINAINFVAQGPAGEQETEQVYVYAPTALQFRVVSPWDQVLISTGFSFFAYSQTSFGLYESLNGVLSVKYHTPSMWKWGGLAEGDMSVLTLAASPVENGPQLLQLKLDGSYRFDPRRHWSLEALAGASYMTMFTYGAPFGFSDLIAPEIGVRARRPVSPLAEWVGSARYVILGSLSNPGEYGFNISAGWSKVVNESHRVEVGLDYAQTGFDSGTNGDKLRVNWLTLRVGLSI